MIVRVRGGGRVMGGEPGCTAGGDAPTARTTSAARPAVRFKVAGTASAPEPRPWSLTSTAYRWGHPGTGGWQGAAGLGEVDYGGDSWPSAHAKRGGGTRGQIPTPQNARGRTDHMVQALYPAAGCEALIRLGRRSQRPGVLRPPCHVLPPSVGAGVGAQARITRHLRDVRKQNKQMRWSNRRG